MTMYALQRRAKDCGITVSSLHPGTVSYHNYIYMYTSVRTYVMYTCRCMHACMCINEIKPINLLQNYIYFMH